MGSGRQRHCWPDLGLPELVNAIHGSGTSEGKRVPGIDVNSMGRHRQTMLW